MRNQRGPAVPSCHSDQFLTPSETLLALRFDCLLPGKILPIAGRHSCGSVAGLSPGAGLLSLLPVGPFAIGRMLAQYVPSSVSDDTPMPACTLQLRSPILVAMPAGSLVENIHPICAIYYNFIII